MYSWMNVLYLYSFNVMCDVMKLKYVLFCLKVNFHFFATHLWFRAVTFSWFEEWQPYKMCYRIKVFAKYDFLLPEFIKITAFTICSYNASQELFHIFKNSASKMNPYGIFSIYHSCFSWQLLLLSTWNSVQL